MRELKNNFILCPVCGGKTRTKIRPDTRAENLIVFCPKCKRESVVNVYGNRKLANQHKDSSET